GPLVACPLKRTNVCLYGSGGRAAPMARAYQLISADSHILEPPHLWRQYMPRKFHDKAPKVVPDGEGGEAWQFAPDAPPAPIGIACMPALGVEESIREMERCLRLGMHGVWLNTMPSVGPTIRPEDDKFWDAAQALGVPVHFHVRVMRQLQKPKAKGVRGDDLTGLATVGARDMIVDMAEIIQSGVHDRFPDLIWVAVETGCGWIPYLLEQLDDRWWRNRS